VVRKIEGSGVCSFRLDLRQIASPTILLSMNAVPLLLLALSIATAAGAQDTPAPGVSAPAAPDASSAPPAAVAVEVVKPAIPVSPATSESPVTFTQEQVRQIETALKKQMMLVGMGCGVAGLLVGMMIGRKSAPRSTGRRF
jgi:hypothetical protein